MQLLNRFTHNIIYECGEKTIRKTLEKAHLEGVDLSEANLSGVDLSKVDLSGADLSGANLSKADLSEANLSEADLGMADLSEADLSKADLSGTILRNCCFHNTAISYRGKAVIISFGVSFLKKKRG